MTNCHIDDNIPDDINTTTDQKWQKVTHKKSNKIGRTLVVGNYSRPPSIQSIKPNTSAEDLQVFRNKNFPEAMCAASGKPDIYSSFKVQISKINYEKAMDPSIYPINTTIFFFNRKKGNQRTTELVRLPNEFGGK